MARVRSVQRSPAVDLLGRGNLDALVDGRGLTIHGWACGREHPATDIEILEEGKVLVRMPVAIPRSDVPELVGDLPGAAESGFMATLRSRGAGRGELDVRVLFADGSVAALGTIATDGCEWGYFQSPAALSRVLVGRDGWLFLRGDSNDSVGQHAGRVTFGEEDREALRRLLSRRAAAARAEDVVWLTAVVPDKEVLYPEELPADSVPVERRPVHEFLSIAAASEAAATYLLDPLREAKGEGDLYMRTDTHWNYRGALVAARAICREMAERGIEVETLREDWLEWEEPPFRGDLDGKLPHAPPGTKAEARFVRSWGRRVYDNEVRNHGRVMIHEQDRRKRPSCVVFGESFAETLLYFLKEVFGRVVFAHTSMYVDEVVAAERPDVVLSLPIERFLIKVPDDREALARLAETARSKGGEVPWAPVE